MSATKSARRQRRAATRHGAHGATVIEFALIAMTFFTLLFFVMETARALYLWNTLQEVTRRAAYRAAVTDPGDPAAMLAVRQAALMNGAGGLPLGAPVAASHVRVDYMSLARDGGGGMALVPMPAALWPACPARAKLNCAADPNADNCIRFVRVRICRPDGAPQRCAPVPYQSLTGLSALTVTLPLATTIGKAESLGFVPGAPLCP